MAHSHEHSHGHEYEPDDEHDEGHDELQHCIEECLNCHAVCTMTAQYCLTEGGEHADVNVIGVLLDCAEICATTGMVLSRRTGSDASVTEALLEACRVACRVCGNECASHADMHEHCRICAEACHRCEVACAALLSEMG